MAIKVERVVFLSLLLDLFAFTIPLPLFPRIIEWYTVVSHRIAVVDSEAWISTQHHAARIRVSRRILGTDAPPRLKNAKLSLENSSEESTEMGHRATR